MNNLELLLGLIKHERPDDFREFEMYLKRYTKVLSDFGKLETIEKNCIKKSESEIKTYLDPIKKQLELLPIENIEGVVTRLGGAAVSKMHPFGKIPFEVVIKWLNDVYSTASEMYDYYYGFDSFYNITFSKFQGKNYLGNFSKEITLDYHKICRKLGWLHESDEFKHQINILESEGYIKIINGKITFACKSSHEDIIGLYYYWFKTNCIKPKKRDKKPLIPQTIISEVFYRLENDIPIPFNASTIGSINDKLTPEDRETKIEIFRKIMN